MLVEVRIGEVLEGRAVLGEVILVERRHGHDLGHQWARVGQIVRSEVDEVLHATAVPPKSLVRVPLDPVPLEGGAVVVDVVVARGVDVGIEVAEEVVDRQRTQHGLPHPLARELGDQVSLGRVVQQIDQCEQVAPVVRGLIGLQLVPLGIGRLIGTVPGEIGRYAPPSHSEGITRLEQIAVLVIDPAVQEGLVHLLHHAVETKQIPVHAYVAEDGPWRQHALFEAIVEEDLLTQHGGVVEPVVQVQLLQAVVFLAAHILVEVDLHGLLFRQTVAAVAFQPHTDTVIGIGAHQVRERHAGQQVALEPFVVIGDQAVPVVGLGEGELDVDHLIGVEQLIARGLCGQGDRKNDREEA